MMYRNVIRKATAAQPNDPNQPKNFDHVPFTDAELDGAKVVRAFYHGKDERFEIVNVYDEMVEIIKLRKDGERYKRRNTDVIWKSHIVEIYEYHDHTSAAEVEADEAPIELPSNDLEAVTYIAEQVAAQYHEAMAVEVEVKETTYKYIVKCNRFATTVDVMDFVRYMKELAGERFTVEAFNNTTIHVEVSSDEKLRRYLASKVEDAFAIMDEYEGGHVELIITHDEEATYAHGIELEITGYTFHDDTHEVAYTTRHVLVTRTHMEHIARSYGRRAYRIISKAIEERNKRGGSYYEVNPFEVEVQS